LSEPITAQAATAGNFDVLVLDNSRRGPVVVYYWSPEAGPCGLLMERLQRLAGEWNGRFLLVACDTRHEGALARAQGVSSIPHVKVYRNGGVVEDLRAADSETALRRMLERHAGPVLSPGHVAGLRAAQRLAGTALEAPVDLRIPAALVKVLLMQGDAAAADRLLGALPDAAQRDPAIADIVMHVRFLRAAAAADNAGRLRERIAADPGDLQARFELAARALISDDYRLAMAELLEIAHRDRGFGDDAGRRGLRAVLEVPGADPALVARYRAELDGLGH